MQFTPESPSDTSTGAFPFEIDWATLAAGGLLLALVVGLGVAALVAQRRRAGPRPRRPEPSSSLMLAHAPDPSEGYVTLRDYNPGAAGLNKRQAVMAKPEATPAPGLRTIDAAVVHEGGRTLFRVVMLDGPLAWRAGDALYLDGGEAPALLEDGVGAEAVREAVKNARELIVFGLAAAEAGDEQRDATRLSYARAIHLGKAMVNLGLARREQVVALGLGAHKGKDGANGGSRTGVVIAMLQAFHPDMEADVVQAAADVLAAHGVVLADYAHAEAPAEFWNIAPGAYGGFIPGDWEQTDARSFRGV